MTYQHTLDWLFAQLPMYQRTGGANYKIDLEKTHQLMALLGHPEDGFKSMHVAGTNGKGSVSHLLASALQEKGLKVGLYTSPHLKDFRERIRINGEMISKEAVIEFVERHKTRFTDLQLSFFEMTVGMAFDYFRNESVDIAVVEVGMGGRLDSTNVLSPLVSVITNISLDHTQFLGNTVEKIAGEKGGIIKPKTPSVIGRTQPESTPVFNGLAEKNQANIIYADREEIPPLQTDLKGDYQRENVATAWTALQYLPEEIKPTIAQIEYGFKHVVDNTGLLGRWQQLGTNPLIIADTGHNIDGLRFVINQIGKTPYNNLHMVWGMVNDKNLAATLNLLPKDATYYFCKPNLPRGLDAQELHETALRAGLHGKPYDRVQDAYKQAKKTAQKDDFIFVGGSTFVVAEVL